MKEIKSHFPKAFLARQGETFTELEERLRKVGEGFVTALSEVEDADFYTPVTESKWSPAELADHLVKANELFGRALENVLKGEDIIVMERGRVTDDGRPLSPAAEEPDPDRPRSELVQAFEKTLRRLITAGSQVKDADRLGEVCVDQSFFGPMTGLENLQLCAWHIRHHTKQLPTYQA